MEHYTCKLSVKLSRNYNSIEASAEYGRDIKPKETTKQLIDQVESVTKERLTTFTGIIDKQLGDTKNAKR